MTGISIIYLVDQKAGICPTGVCPCRGRGTCIPEDVQKDLNVIV